MQFRSRRQRGRPRHPDVLTPTEWRVLGEVRAGQRNADIAEQLGLSIHTVKSHVSNMLAKLDLRGRRQLAQWPGTPERTGNQHDADRQRGTVRFEPVPSWAAARAMW